MFGDEYRAYVKLTRELVEWFNDSKNGPMAFEDFQAAMITAGLMEFDTYKLVPWVENDIEASNR